MIFEMLATLAAGLFAGAAIYVTAVEHPARMDCGPDLAIREFAPSYRRGTVMQVSLAVVGFLTGAAASYTTESYWWLVGGTFLVAAIPFTLIVIFPTNKKLLDPSLERNSQLATALLTRWGRLHAVRSLLSLISFLIFVILLSRFRQG
jgi:hypothetical protein